MKRRLFLGLTAAAFATPAFGQSSVDLSLLSDYINGIDTAQGRFRQLNADQTVVSGRYWIDRPGLMRFQYDGENPPVIIADGTWLGVVDPVPGTSTQRYPLGRTPLKLLLERNLRLEREEIVQAVERRGGHLVVTARDPDQPQIGTLAMVFREDPLALTEWVTVDQSGRATIVELQSMERGMPLERSLFSIEQAEFNRDR